MSNNLSKLLDTIVPNNIFANFERRVIALSSAPLKIDKPVKIIKLAKLPKPLKPPIEKKISAKRKEKIIAEKIALKKRQEERSVKNVIEKKIVDNRNFNKRKYKTKIVDYSQLITIRINPKTVIYSKPGEEEITKANFLKNYTKSLSQKDQNQNQ